MEWSSLGVKPWGQALGPSIGVKYWGQGHRVSQHHIQQLPLPSTSVLDIDEEVLLFSDDNPQANTMPVLLAVQVSLGW